MNRSTRSISRPTVTFITRSMRCCRLARMPGRAEQVLGGAAPPFAHRRGEHRGHRIGRTLTDPLVEIVERAAGPERLLEARRRLPQPAHPHHLVEDHRPRPERGEQQDQHHQFDDGVGLQEQPDDREVMRNRTGERQGVDGVRLHCCRPFMASFGRLLASGRVLDLAPATAPADRAGPAGSPASAGRGGGRRSRSACGRAACAARSPAGSGRAR